MKNHRALKRAIILAAAVLPLALPTAASAAKLSSLETPDTRAIRDQLKQVTGQAPSGTTLVTPGADAAWLLTDEGVGGSGTVSPASYQGYGLAPAGGPLGVGAFHQRIGAGALGDRLMFGTGLHGGQHLGSVSQLSYSTWTAPNGSPSTLAPALSLMLDLDGDGFYTGFTNDDILVFEPVYQTGTMAMLDPADSTASQCGNPCVLEGTWQSWNAREGAWYSRRGDGVNRWNGINFESIEHYLSRYPSAKIASNPASISFRSGSGWSDVDTHIDALRVDAVVYDFEPTVSSVDPKTPQWFSQVNEGSPTTEYMSRWTEAGSRQSIVDGASFTGRGSLQQIIGQTADGGLDDRIAFGTPTLAGTRLSALNDVAYATFLEAGSSLRPAVLSLRLDLNGNGIFENTEDDDVLQFLPSTQATPVVTGQWQYWSARAGSWYSRRSGTDAPLSTFIAHPDYSTAVIALSDASVELSLGSGYSNIRGFADSLSINGKLYDIEPAVQTVSPADGSGGWFYNPPLDQSGSSSNRQALVNGPAVPPLNDGSLSQRSSDGTTKLSATTPMFSGKSLREITSLSFWTHRATPSAQMPAIKIGLDLDGDMMYTSSTTDLLLVFEPVYQVQVGQPALQTGVWQRWDATEGGWYATGRQLSGSGCTTGTGQPPVCRLRNILESNAPSPATGKVGDLKIGFGSSSIDIQVSPTGNPDVASDRVNINGTLFDFEAALPSGASKRIDGNRGADEGYTLLTSDAQAEVGSMKVDIYGACSATDMYLYVESPNDDVYVGNLFFDVNANDKWDGANSTDRIVYFNESGAFTEPNGSTAIPTADARRSFTNKAFEVKLPRSWTGGGWFQYDVVSSGLSRNTGWGTQNYANMARFLPDPCTYTPKFVNGAVAVDCDRRSDDMRLIQHLLDRGPGSTVKLHGTCNVTAAPAHGGDQVKIAAAALVLERDGTTVESLDQTRKARLLGSGTQAGVFVAPGTKDATVRGLWLQGMSRGIVAHNTTRTTIGYRPPDLQQISPLGNRIIGTGNLQEGILAVGAGNGMGQGTATSVTVAQGNLAGGTRTYSLTGAAQRMTDVTIAGNYVSYNPPGPLTNTSDVTGIVVRQNGAGRGIDGVEVSQNAVGMASSDFPSFNYAGIRVHADSNDPNFAHITDVSVFKNTLGRIEELNLSESGLPDAGDLHATGRVGIAIGRVGGFDVKGNSIRTILSAVPSVNMIGGGIVVYDSFEGNIETNSIITIAGANTEDEDLGAIGIVDNLMNAFNANGAAGKPTRDITIVSNYAGWSTSGPSQVGTQRGIVINGADRVTTMLNQMKTTSAHSLLISIPISGAGQLFGGPETMPALPVTGSSLCTNWLDSYNAPGNAQDVPLSEVRFGGQFNGSTGNRFPGGGVYGGGNASC